MPGMSAAMIASVGSAIFTGRPRARIELGRLHRANRDFPSVHRYHSGRRLALPFCLGDFAERIADALLVFLQQFENALRQQLHGFLLGGLRYRPPLYPPPGTVFGLRWFELERVRGGARTVICR